MALEESAWVADLEVDACNGRQNKYDWAGMVTSYPTIDRGNAHMRQPLDSREVLDECGDLRLQRVQPRRTDTFEETFPLAERQIERELLNQSCSVRS